MPCSLKPTHSNPLVDLIPGPSGLAFLNHALHANHELTIFARNPSKLPPATHSSPQIHIIKGEFSDLDRLREALAYGAEVLVSFAGPSIPNSGTVRSYSPPRLSS